MLFPRVQQEELQEKYFSVPRVSLWAGEHTERAGKALSLLLPEVIVPAEEPQALICCALQDGLPSEGYALRLEQDKVRLSYGSYAGLVRGLATLSLLFVKDEQGLRLPMGQVSDAPVCTHRGVMLDPARGVPPLQELCNSIILAARARMNVVHLHLTDSKGLAVELNALPAALRLPGAYTREEMAEIARLCDVLALELIPEFDVPAHATGLLRQLPALGCPVPAEVPWCLCAGNEAVYTLLSQAVEELCTLLPGGKYFHIGGDELEFSDFAPPRLCHWAECPVCREKMEAEGLQDRREMYYYFANRMNAIVKARGRQTIMWSEQIDCTRPVSIDRDVVMQFWRVAYPGRGPVEGCSMQRQLELGYTVINSQYSETYIDLEKYMNTTDFVAWRHDERPECSPELKGQILGSEVCAWEYGNREKFAHYDHSLPSAIALMGDKLWSGLQRPYGTEEACAMTRLLLGAAAPRGMNVFAAVGDVFPPRSEAKCYPEKITATKEELLQLVQTLGQRERFVGYEGFAAVYLDCAKEALTHR